MEQNIYRSSRPEVFCKKGVLRNFVEFTGKHLCQNFFFNKVEGPKPATLLKKRPWHRWFPVNFVKFLRTALNIEHLWWLLLYLVSLVGKICNILPEYKELTFLIYVWFKYFGLGIWVHSMNVPVDFLKVIINIGFIWTLVKRKFASNLLKTSCVLCLLCITVLFLLRYDVITFCIIYSFC